MRSHFVDPDYCVMTRRNFRRKYMYISYIHNIYNIQSTVYIYIYIYIYIYNVFAPQIFIDIQSILYLPITNFARPKDRWTGLWIQLCAQGDVKE